MSEAEYQAAFVDFMQKYKKTYEHSEFALRYQTFKQNLEFIDAHNKATREFTVAMNEFGDLSAKEFAAIFNGAKLPKGVKFEPVKMPQRIAGVDVSALPKTVDWRKKGAVTGVKNQGQCGSCWSFSTTGTVEGQHFLAGQGTLVGLSEQNLVDCSTPEGCEGCDGCWPTWAMKYIISNGGVDLEADYPYTAEDGTCHYKVADRGACIQKFEEIPAGNETALQVAVATVGPISVCIDASQSSFQFYESGVYYSYFCSSTELDHAVLAVGYGTDSTIYGAEDYWLVKNSWGTSWGDAGYIKMIRNWDNNCGIATAASYPVITKKTC